MSAYSKEHSAFEVRSDLATAHHKAWSRLGEPGTWLDAQTRIAIAAEVRRSQTCALCERTKVAVSPYAVTGTHDAGDELPAPWIDIVHRIVADPGRLTKGWFDRTVGTDISEPEYVELVAIVAQVTAIDTFARAIGSQPWPLPDAVSGTPSQYRPDRAELRTAWVRTLAWDDHGPNEADFFDGPTGNIRTALTLVPDEARSFWNIVFNQYLPIPAMRDWDNEYRAVTHAQIELLAGRVSALNQCTY